MTGADLYGDEPCRECGALVRGRRNMRVHKDWHAQLDEDINGVPEPADPGGYVLPDASITITGPVVEAFPGGRE
jgi:hypothetical protein